MYCKNCGKEIEQDSKFCKYCGGSVSPVLNSEPDTRPDLPAKQKTKRGFGFIVVLLLVAVALFPIFFNQPSVPASKTQPKESASGTAKSYEAPDSSEYQNKIMSLSSMIREITTRAVKKELANPETLRVVCNYNSVYNDGVIFTNPATVSYTNRNGESVSQPVEVSFVLNEEETYYVLALKMGDSVLYDHRSSIDKNGKILTTQIRFSGRGTGELILDNLYNPDDWEKSASSSEKSDFDNSEPEMTLNEFNRIETGMTYDEVCKIVGSYGFEMSRSEIAGYQTVIVGWDGIGQIGANANVTFQNGKVIAKAQAGLS